ncbi:MAG: hypothetical protein S4CHLAM6_13940 [Chlamydiae bacterium]|nr:hypothetical protein [Chlamydiota bacterium]
MLSNSSIAVNSNFSMPLSLGDSSKDPFNITSSGYFDPPPPPGGPGAPFSPLFNQPVFNLVPSITIDWSFLKDLALPNALKDLTDWTFSKLPWTSDKGLPLLEHDFTPLTGKTKNCFSRLCGTVNTPETTIHVFPLSLDGRHETDDPGRAHRQDTRNQLRREMKTALKSSSNENERRRIEKAYQRQIDATMTNEERANVRRRNFERNHPDLARMIPRDWNDGLRMTANYLRATVILAPIGWAIELYRFFKYEY